ncbi:energy transducer TonB [Pedobacter frigoris]|uniref:TonB family protein n=1 Tax=Pedobacter frigoris TaxID=2571272 RepID=A0A4U1CJ84_9SPHI|nr:energy transducer TonB [Pedobacter frigoris]TKC07483.1 TonB family protein [Pedobacter frigoris]
MTRIIYLIVLTVGISITGYAQSKKADSSTIEQETLPEFPGGQLKMVDFTKKNLSLAKPSNAGKAASGRVVVSFIVKADGSLTDIKVLRGMGEPYNTNALKLVRSFPKFKPATKNGKNIDYPFSIPIPVN